MTTAAMQRGAAGIVTDGAVRDLARMDAMGFPVFARHLSPYDSMNRQKVVAFDVAIEIDGVAIAPGDIVIRRPRRRRCGAASPDLRVRIGDAVPDSKHL
jgi:regulator of RNase E activity RraA